ncbi:claudin-16-like [Ambystoma mexicanum]|uniref:claudin-16-like n=1 Tax=Ambystoma mexicanum TaxID=8296 RepID=UPI0037E8F089
MGNPAAAEFLALLLGGIAVLSLIVSSVTDCWRQDAKDPHSSVGLSSRCRGLWSECVYDNMADLWTCDIPVSYLNEHPVSLVITRALMVVKGVLCIIALPILILGMKCTTFVHVKRQKYAFSVSSGILFLLGGLSGGVAVLWYAVDTVLKYRLEVSLGVPGVTYELGYSYWMTAAGTVCASTSGMLLIGMKCSQTQMEKKRKYLTCKQAAAQRSVGIIYL